MNRMTATLIGLTAAALLLSGCATTSAPDSKPAATGKPVVISTSTQSATPALAIPGDVSGDGKLDGWERERLAAASYGLPNGTKVALPALGAPLPASVVRAVQAHVLAQGNLAAVPGDVKNAVDAKALAVVDAESQRRGRTIIPVFHTYDGDVGGTRWCAGGPAAGSGCSYNEAATVAIAAAWVGSQTQYVVVAFG